MGNEYLRLTDTKLNIKKAENLLAVISAKRKDKLDRKDTQSENSIFTALYKAFKDFFSNLGKPTLKLRYQKKESPPVSRDYNDTMQELHDDIGVGYAEENSLSSVMVKNFNYGEIEKQMLTNKVRKLASKSIDYSFYSEGAKSNSIFGVDSLVDNSKIDFSKITPGAQEAELISHQGVITLKRISNTNRSPLVEKVTGIQESIPDWNPHSQTGGYEGLYYGLKNESRPEGGNWHISYAEDGKTLWENGAAEEALMARRLQMFDDTPDTFWEVEMVTNPIQGYRNRYSGDQITAAEFNELVNNEINSPNIEIVGDTVVTKEYGNLIEDYIPVTETSAREFLSVSFTVHLERTEQMNWISLLPNNFGKELYMEVLSIQTSADGEVFEELEGFDDHEYDIVLTKEANQELTPSMVKDTLAPDRFKFAGQGIWVFAARKVKCLKFIIRQTRSYNKPYDVLMVETEQVITSTTTKKKFFGGAKTSTSTQVVKKTAEIPYLIGLVCGFDVLDLEPGAIDIGGSDSTGLASTIGAAAGGIAGFMLGGLVGGPIGMIAGLLLGGLFGSSKKTETTVGPQTIKRQWVKAKEDKARFAIGIRDINMYAYKFAETSEVVSEPYTSPKPISKITLAVDEQIPRVFYTSAGLSGTENEWIKYYVSADDGTTWYRISPKNHRTTISTDGINNIPEVININSDISPEARDNPLSYVDIGYPVYEVRFRAVLSRPTTIADAESYTPVLSKYALQIYPFGGL